MPVLGSRTSTQRYSTYCYGIEEAYRRVANIAVEFGSSILRVYVMLSYSSSAKEHQGESSSRSIVHIRTRLYFVSVSSSIAPVGFFSSGKSLSSIITSVDTGSFISVLSFAEEKSLNLPGSLLTLLCLHFISDQGTPHCPCPTTFSFFFSLYYSVKQYILNNGRGLVVKRDRSTSGNRVPTPWGKTRELRSGWSVEALRPWCCYTAVAQDHISRVDLSDIVSHYPGPTGIYNGSWGNGHSEGLHTNRGLSKFGDLRDKKR